MLHRPPISVSAVCRGLSGCPGSREPGAVHAQEVVWIRDRHVFSRLKGAHMDALSDESIKSLQSGFRERDGQGG